MPGGYEEGGRNNAGDFEVALVAYEQLAMYYEHRAREHRRAAELTRKALVELRRALRLGLIELGRCRRLQTRLEHRLARLTRRIKGGDSRPLLESSFSEARSKALESK